MILDAARDITLEAGQNQKTLDGSNSSSGWSVGVALTVGEKTGITISASANKGSEEGNGNNWNETTLKAGGDLILQSGRDTTLTGATASGETVIADVGRDLTLTSLQDQDSYHSKQQDASAGVSFTFGPSGGLSASLNLSKQKIDSDYNSIQEQTGLYAGKGGFDVTVGNHTQLNGAVIASTSDPENNWLDTGTLGFGNLHNQADFKSESQSIGISTSNPAASAMSAASNLAGGNNSGHAESTTYAAVSEGTINIRDTENQQQNVDDLSRDVEHAASGLDPIFDKEKEQKRLQQAKLIGEIGQQVMTIIRTEGQIEANKAAMAALEDSDKVKAARDQLEKDGNSTTDKAVQELVYKTAYDEVMKGYGTGSNLQTAAQAVTAALQGLAGGNLDAALAGAAAPYLAGVIKDLTQGNPEANKFAHAVLGAVIAQLKGESALAGGVAAGAAPAIAKILQEKMYPGVKTEDLSEEQKQTLSALTTLAGGLVGGLATGDASGALTGGQAAKNEVENNYLAPAQASKLLAELNRCRTNRCAEADYKKIVERYQSLAAENSAAMLQCEDRACVDRHLAQIKSIESTVLQGLRQFENNKLSSVDLIGIALGDPNTVVSPSLNPFDKLATGSYALDKDLALAKLIEKGWLTPQEQKQLDSWSASTSWADEAASAYYGRSPTIGEKAAFLILATTEGGAAAAQLAKSGVKLVVGGLNKVDPSLKIATGVSVGEFEKGLANLPAGERVAIIKSTSQQVATANGFVKDSILTQKNNRDVYRGPDGNLYALDTRHGRFEVLNSRGKHLGEVDFSMQIRKPADSSGSHNLKVK